MSESSLDANDYQAFQLKGMLIPYRGLLTEVFFYRLITNSFYNSHQKIIFLGNFSIPATSFITANPSKSYSGRYILALTFEDWTDSTFMQIEDMGTYIRGYIQGNPDCSSFYISLHLLNDSVYYKLHEAPGHELDNIYIKSHSTGGIDIRNDNESIYNPTTILIPLT